MREMRQRKIVEHATDMRAAAGNGSGKPKVSRQRLWQIRQNRKGKCMCCSEKRYQGSPYCKNHLSAAKLRSRKRQGGKAWKQGGPGRPPLSFLAKTNNS